MKHLSRFVFLAAMLMATVVPSAFGQVYNDVIINEFAVNPASGDGKEFVELLVTKLGGLDMRNWALSDLSTKGPAGAGTEGRLIIPNTALFSNVARGTRIVLVYTTPIANVNEFGAEDLDASDSTIILFSDVLGGTAVSQGVIDNSTNENIVLLTDSTASAVTIDYVATGTNVSQPNYPDAIWASPNLAGGSNLYFFTNNAGGGLINDTSSSGWTANAAMAGRTPGELNVGQALPGGGISDGAGTATLVNATVGTYNGSTVFPRTTASQTVTVSVTGTSGGTIDKVSLTVPATWGTYSSGNVSMGGGFSGSLSFLGNVITVNGAALGTTAGTITITGLTSSNPVGAGLSGNEQWIVKTAIAAGTLTNIAASPSSHTIIPIQNLRTGGTDGFGNSDAGLTPVLNNTTVAVLGIITVPNRVLAETTSTSIVIQDGNFGLQVFRSATQSHTTLLLGNSITVKGTITAFNGNTEIVPASITSPNLFNHGAASLPSAQILTSALAIAESTESRLVKINSVNWDSAGQVWEATSASSADNNFKTGADAGTAYFNFVNTMVGNAIPASSPITGVVYHRSDQTGGGQLAHKIAPRNALDLGQDPADGTGTASIVPLGRVANQVAVGETLTVTGDGVNTLGGASVTIPSSWTWNGSSYSLSGAGFGSATSAVTGDGSGGNPWVITVSNASVTNVNTGLIRIQNLGTPVAAGVTTFLTKTRGTSGTLGGITTSPTVNIGSAFEAVASGNWSNTATWAGGAVPTASDDVTLSTLGVTVTIDISNAVCNNLTLTGSGTASNSGPMLQFDASGTKQLTVNGSVSVSGGSGGGGGDRGGRPKLTSNGNTSATLIVKKNITSTSSNSTTNDNAGFNMNEGTVKLTGTTADTLRFGAGVRLGNLEVGDGVGAKTVLTNPTTNMTMAVVSITVKQNATLWIGTESNTSVVTVGNGFTSGIPTMTGGINVETGASLRVLESTAGFVASNIYLNGGGIINNGTIDLLSAAAPEALTGCVFHVSFGGFSQSTPSVAQSVSGSAAGTFANVKVDSAHVVTFNQDMTISNGYKLTIGNGTIAETAGNTVSGVVEATRNVGLSLENFGGMGLEIDADVAPGSTVATRTTGTAVSGSVVRYFNIAPTVNSGLNAALNYYYDDSELNGNVEANLTLHKSTDAGVSWTNEGGTVTPASNKIALAGVNSLSRWVASDHTLSGFSVNVSIATGWNMISNPVTATNDSVRDLYPTSSFDYAFSFSPSAGYQQSGVLENGVGYWGKFPGDVSQNISGFPRDLDSIPVQTGWNMIGSISTSVDTSTIISVPGGIRSSQYFGYSAGYTAAQNIVPGKAYWVKASAPGVLILDSPSPSRPAKPATRNPLEGFSTLTITDKNGASQTLFLGADESLPVDMFEMPPHGPEGVFDARFTSNRMVEVYAKNSQNARYTVDMRATAYPLIVSWEVKGERKFMLSDGASLEKAMVGVGQVAIASGSVKRLTVSTSSNEIPTEFSLQQNYPNPFNPATTISFGLPAEARVTLRVFNLLGQQVAEVAGGIMAAGFHEFAWEGKSSFGAQAGSGVYFYKLDATSTETGQRYSEVRKMVLLK
ncbi:MAG: FlgD immunoglobulin-like domain containing protein [Bacteroidota bacterium]